MSKSIIERLENYKEEKGSYDELIQSMQHVLPSKKRTDFKFIKDRNRFTGPLKDILEPVLGLKSQSMATKSLYNALIHMLDFERNIVLSQRQTEPDAVGISMIYGRIENFKSKGLQQHNNQ